MGDHIRLLVSGGTGKMGKAIVTGGSSAKGLSVVGIVDSSPVSVGSVADIKLPLFDTLDLASDAEVVVDFSVPVAAAALARVAATRGMALVTGTTGLNPDQQREIEAAAAIVPVVQSGNFSLGVNLLMALVEDAAKKLSGFDIEVTETHHRDKIDSPSGTALMLGEAAARGAGTTLTEKGVFSRHGQVGPRREGEIGFSVIRGGGVVGDHGVAFLSGNETITLSHHAMDRRLFADGALYAARWIVGRSPGLYTMSDVLNLR